LKIVNGIGIYITHLLALQDSNKCIKAAGFVLHAFLLVDGKSYTAKNLRIVIHCYGIALSLLWHCFVIDIFLGDV